MDKKIQNYEILNIIGKGSFGNVYLSRNIQSDKNYAAKKITKSQFQTKKLFDYFTNEVTLLKRLNHKNIVRFKDLIEKDDNIYLFTEYCNGGSLEDVLRFHLYNFNSPIPEKTVKFFIKNILQGIAYLNENNIIHRDIKSNNILLKYENENDMITRKYENAKIKIIDFGFAKFLDNKKYAQSLVGSPMYMEPTLLKSLISDNKNNNNDNIYDKKIDVWSLGVLTYELLLGNLPFNGKNLKELYTNIDNRKFIINRDILKKINLSEAAINFIDNTLNIDVNKRKLPIELLNDPWIVGNNENNKIYKLRNNSPEDKICFINYWEQKNKNNIIGERLLRVNHKRNIKSMWTNISALKDGFYPISSIGKSINCNSDNKLYLKTSFNDTFNSSNQTAKNFNNSDKILDNILKYHNKETISRYTKFIFNKKLNNNKAQTNKTIRKNKIFQKILDKIQSLHNEKNEKTETSSKKSIKNTPQIPLIKNKKTKCTDNKFLVKKININLYYIDNNNVETNDKSIGSNYTLTNNAGNNIKKITDGNYFHIKNFTYYAGVKEKKNKNKAKLNHSCDKFRLLHKRSFFDLN